MRGSSSTRFAPVKQQIPRIEPREAAKILKQCERFLEDAQDHLRQLHAFGFAEILGRMSDDILRLAIQPDSWGERARARLMSDIAPALQGDVAQRHAVSIEDIAYCSNIVMPCLLLELGRRKRHIEIEFPPDPTDSSARFKICAGRPFPFRSITNQQLLRLVSQCGEDLVGLCYFGDQKSRRWIEAELASQSGVRHLKVRSLRTSPSTGHKQ
ncbi:MAG: hypothetical protein JWN45_297 [Acidobacteriaceae bacterium]|nr:hypothetical protein [Acidobacteriaceae bacterium]